jgi:hypothetical protein
MGKKKTHDKNTEKHREEYESAKQKIIKNAEYNVFPSPSDYEMFYKTYLALFGHFLPKCIVCYKPLTPKYPQVFEPYISLSECTDTRYRDNCPVLSPLGLRKRCGSVEVAEDQVAAGDAYEMKDGAVCLGPWGKCRDLEDIHEKSIILENFVFNIGVRKNKQCCSPQCKKKHQNQVYDKRHPGEKRLSQQRYINGLVEDEDRNRKHK